MAKTLLLRLNAPMQSWGSSSVYDHRESDDMPTKSGVIGLVAAALGRKRDEALDDLVSLQFGVRIDAPGTRMTDFQITQMGEKLNANLSTRVYLCDATFVAGLSSENETLLEKIDMACRNPIFSLFLGRRSCPPTVPLSLGIRDEGLYDALVNEPWQVADWRKKDFFKFSDSINLRIVVDDVESAILKKDNPISFSPFQRIYGYRSYTEKKAKRITNDVKLTETAQDPMTELG